MAFLRKNCASHELIWMKKWDAAEATSHAVFRGLLVSKIADTVCPDLKGFGVI